MRVTFYELVCVCVCVSLIIFLDILLMILIDPVVLCLRDDIYVYNTRTH